MDHQLICLSSMEVISQIPLRRDDDRAKRWQHFLKGHYTSQLILPTAATVYRKRQQAVAEKKNAERAIRKTHFRSHRCLPRQTTTARKPATAKEDSFFGAFQGLSLDGLIGGSPAVTAPAAGGGDQCKVM
ncbi:hypothetical protein LDENG_00164700 [Lucifuga dentata]|nr:hypothetical protein LDENG_00164700 [Lucifuga dentata]